MGMKNKLLLIIISLTYCAQNGAKVTNDTLAIVNQRTISSQDFAAQAESIKNAPGVNLGSKDGRIAILKEMIDEDLVFQKALEEEFYRNNLNVKHEVVKEYLKHHFAKDIPVISEQKMQESYKEHKEKIDIIRASHILIVPEKKDNDASKKEAFEKIKRIREEIASGKISFADAATKYSQDRGSQTVKGDLGYFEFIRMTKPFSEAAFAIKKVGDMSPVTETEYGYHIILLTGDVRGFEANKEKIRSTLYQNIMKPKVDEYFTQLREKAKTQILNKDIMSIPVAKQ